MISKHFKISLLLIATIILTLGLSISFQSLLAAWTAPLDNPPTCTPGNPGCDEPVNKGSNLQIKGGPLYVNYDNIAATGFVAYGNVGIGTTSPLTKLSIQGAAGANDILNIASSIGASIIYINSAGKVRVGTTSGTTPAGIVDIIGTVSDTSQEVLNIKNSNSAYLASLGADDNGDGKLLLADVSSGTQMGSAKVNIYANGNSYFNGGNVGIGTANPTAKLTIGGTAGVDGIKFPDGTLQTTAATSVGEINFYYRNSGGTSCCDIGDVLTGCSHDSTPDDAGARPVTGSDKCCTGYPNAYVHCYDKYTGSMLYGGNHIPTDCTNIGGTVVSIGADNICKMSGSSCVSPWISYNNYTTTTAVTCIGTNASGCTGATNCTTLSHAFSSSAVETCAYKNRTKVFFCTDSAQTCTATISQVGCY